MSIRTNSINAAVAATLALGLLGAPAAYAMDDMKKTDTMSESGKPASSMSNMSQDASHTGMASDKMQHSDAMKNDAMKNDPMKKTDTKK